MPKLTNIDAIKNSLVEAMEKSLGIVTTACQKVGITRTTYYKWYKEDKEFRDRVESIESMAFDFVESKLYQLIKEGNPAATIFYLKTKAKSRGYIEKTEMEITDKTKVIKLEIGTDLLPPKSNGVSKKDH